VRALLVVGVLVAAGAVAPGSEATSASTPTVSLTITYWPAEQKPTTSRRWTLRCDPLGGTLPTRRAACRRLARLKASSFAPVPSDAVCTQIYGGPQKAVVKGTVGGARVWASFRRRNGCEIDRWRRFSPWLLPPGGVTG
jgi:subtilisin inhibitor-like